VLLSPRWLASIGALALAALACNVPGIGHAGDSTAATSGGEAEMSLEEALQVVPQDSRPEVLRLMGPPDSFTLQWQELEGQLVRWEEWSYLDAAARFDFIDGELVWTGDLDPALDGALLAHAYNPLDFDPAMTIDDVQSMLTDQSLEEASLAEADIPTGVVLAGDQILLGFDDDRLVYVQTFALWLSRARSTARSPATTRFPSLRTVSPARSRPTTPTRPSCRAAAGR